MLNDWNVWLSIVTALVAIIAIFQTQQQIRISNKQSLFDRRISNYTIIMELVRTYKGNQGLFTSERSDEPILSIGLEFAWLTNNSYLYQVYEVIENPLCQLEQENFLKKCGDLKEIAETSKLILVGEPAEIISNFVLCYEELLFKIYQYQILLNRMQESSQQFGFTLEQSAERMHEKYHRENMLVAYGNLRRLYDEVESHNVIEKIKKQICL